jgi:hypothetical protein
MEVEHPGDDIDQGRFSAGFTDVDRSARFNLKINIPAR